MVEMPLADNNNMKILVRLPNWLGDMVMSIGFINALQKIYPLAAISVVAKKGIHPLLEFFPPLDHRFIFSKEDYPGLKGAWQFGRMVRKKENFDFFFCLPDSFSSALIGFASGAGKRVGYEKEFRSALFTHSYKKPGKGHRVNAYINLLSRFSGKQTESGEITLKVKEAIKKNRIIFNINSEAGSRRLPLQKAVELVKAIRENSNDELVLIGANSDKDFVEAVVKQLPSGFPVNNLAGKTSLAELVGEIAAARIMLSTDSGPAHLANALRIPTVVLFGAGDENHTAPFNEKYRTIIRLGQLPCEPCVKNTCVLFGVPKCLELLDERQVIQSLLL